MGQADELGGVVERIVRAARTRIEPADENQLLDAASERLQEYDKRALAVAFGSVGAVLVVGVHAEPHAHPPES